MTLSDFNKDEKFIQIDFPNILRDNGDYVVYNFGFLQM